MGIPPPIGRIPILHRKLFMQQLRSSAISADSSVSAAPAPVLFRIAAVVFLFILVHILICGLHSLADVVFSGHIHRADSKADIVGVFGQRAQLPDLLPEDFLQDAGAEDHELIAAGTVDEPCPSIELGRWI